MLDDQTIKELRAAKTQAEKIEIARVNMTPTLEALLVLTESPMSPPIALPLEDEKFLEPPLELNPLEYNYSYRLEQFTACLLNMRQMPGVKERKAAAVEFSATLVESQTEVFKNVLFRNDLGTGLTYESLMTLAGMRKLRKEQFPDIQAHVVQEPDLSKFDGKINILPVLAVGKAHFKVRSLNRVWSTLLGDDGNVIRIGCASDDIKNNSVSMCIDDNDGNEVTLAIINDNLPGTWKDGWLGVMLNGTEDMKRAMAGNTPMNDGRDLERHLMRSGEVEDVFFTVPCEPINIVHAVYRANKKLKLTLASITQDDEGGVRKLIFYNGEMPVVAKLRSGQLKYTDGKKLIGKKLNIKRVTEDSDGSMRGVTVEL